MFLFFPKLFRREAREPFFKMFSNFHYFKKETKEKALCLKELLGLGESFTSIKN